MVQLKAKTILVEWIYKGNPRHQACESEASLLSCLHVLTATPVSRDVEKLIVWDEMTINLLVELGQVGHA